MPWKVMGINQLIIQSLKAEASEAVMIGRLPDGTTPTDTAASPRH